MSVVADWCEHRLQQLVDSYRTQYWKGGFASWTAVRRKGKEYRYQVDEDCKRILICPENCESDTDVCEAVLCAMVRVATLDSGPLSRVPSYWQEVERLMELGARFTVRASDFEDRPTRRSWVLRECPNIRAAVERAEASRPKESTEPMSALPFPFWDVETTMKQRTSEARIADL